MCKKTLIDVLNSNNERRTIISFLSLPSLTLLLSLSSLTWKLLNIISDDDDERNDSYSFYIKRLIMTSTLCDKIQYMGNNEKYHFNSSNNNSNDKELLQLILPRLKILEIKNNVLIKRTTLIKLLDYIGEEQLKEIHIPRMNTNSCSCFSNMIIPRLGYSLKSLSLGGAGFTSAMPLSDNNLNQILGFLPHIENLKLMKLGLLSNYSIKSIASYSIKLKKLEILSCTNMRLDKNSSYQFKLLLEKLNIEEIDIRYSIEVSNSLLQVLCDKADSSNNSSIDENSNPYQLKSFLASKTLRQQDRQGYLNLDNDLTIEKWKKFENTFQNADILYIDDLHDECSPRTKNHTFLLNNKGDKNIELYRIPIVLNKYTSFAVKESMRSPSKRKLSALISAKLSTFEHNHSNCLPLENMSTHRKDTFIKLNTTTATSNDNKIDDNCFVNINFLKNCYNNNN